MPPDQAAGLRRRASQNPVRYIHCFFDSPLSATRLAQALHRNGQTSLLVDMLGRLFADCPTRSLFDWRQQLERGQLHMLPQRYGDGWYAPGFIVDELNLPGAALDYDFVVFDAGPIGEACIHLPGTAHFAIIEVHPTHESMLRVYALIKSLNHADDRSSIGLLGAPATCDHVRAACSHFLGQGVLRNVFSLPHEDAPFAELAIRMAGEETSLTTR